MAPHNNLGAFVGLTFAIYLGNESMSCNMNNSNICDITNKGRSLERSEPRSHKELNDPGLPKGNIFLKESLAECE